MKQENRSKKYVVLEHLVGRHKGFRFWTTNSINNTHSMNGELLYKEIAFTDSEDEAIKLSRPSPIWMSYGITPQF